MAEQDHFEPEVEGASSPSEEALFPDLTQPPPPQPPTTDLEPSAPSYDPLAPPVRRGKRPFLIVGGVVVALLAVLLVSGNGLLAKLTPTVAIGRAAAKTANAVEQRLADSPYQAFAVLWNSLLTGGKLEGSFALRDDWSQVQLEFDLASGAGNGQFEGGFSLGFDDLSMDARLYLDKAQAAVASSSLEGGWYGVTFASFEQDLRASALPDALGLDDEDIREAAGTVEDLSQVLSRDHKGAFRAYAQVATDFMKGLEFSSESEKTKVGGAQLTCTEVATELSARQLRALTLDLFDAVAEDESIRDLYISTATANGQSRQELERAYDTEMRQARGQLKASLERLEGELELQYYLHRDHLVKLTLSGEIAVDGHEAYLDYVLDLGADPGKDDWLLAYGIHPVDGDAITAEITFSSRVDGGQYADQLTMVVDDGTVDAVVSIVNQWDPRQGALETELTMDDGYSSETATIESSLLVEKSRFDYSLLAVDGVTLAEQGGHFTLSQEAGHKLTAPEFLNLDRWDEAALGKLGSAALALGQPFYTMNMPMDEYDFEDFEYYDFEDYEYLE